MKLIITMLFALSIFALEGKVRNGADISTRNILLSANKLTSYISKCLASSDCVATAQQRYHLEEIQKIIDPSLIKFIDGPEASVFFTIDGVEKAAITSNTPGSIIYINLKKITPISFADSISLLVHEFGHHIGINDHYYLDSLGVKVALSSSSTYSVYNVLGTKKFSFQVYFTHELNPDVYALYDRKFVNIEDKVIKKNLCPIPGTTLQSYQIVNLYQSEPVDYFGYQLKFGLHLWLRVRCKNQRGETPTFFAKREIHLFFDNQGEKPVYSQK